MGAAGTHVATSIPLPDEEPHVQALASASAHGDSEPMRIVEYVSKSCGHCKALAPIWDSAKGEWMKTHSGDKSTGVIWEEKECFADDWKPGENATECNGAGVASFPTIRFYGGSAGA